MPPTPQVRVWRVTRPFQGALATLLLTSTTACAAPDPVPVGGSQSPAGIHVTGYAVSTLGRADLVRDSVALSTFTPVAVTLHPSGKKLNSLDPTATANARTARSLGLRTELLVSNYDDANGRFGNVRLRKLLSSPANRLQIASELANRVRRGPWDGVNVDFEGLRGADSDAFVLFLKDLMTRLPSSASLSVDVPGETGLSALRMRGYKLRAIGRVVDRVQVMAYDLHHPAWTKAGPVSPLRWQEKVMRAALKAVPASKLDLGVAGYGHYWRTDGTGASISPAEARARARKEGVNPRWDQKSGERTVKFKDGSVAWWGDRRSYRLRLKLAKSLGLHGVAVWRLGSADSLAP